MDELTANAVYWDLQKTQTALRNLVCALQDHEKETVDFERTHNQVMKAYMEALYILKTPDSEHMKEIWANAQPRLPPSN